MKFLKNIIIILLLGITLYPSVSFAQLGKLDFGAKLAFVAIPCTCNPGTFHLIFAAPFYAPLPVMIGALDYNAFLSLPATPGTVPGMFATYHGYKPEFPMGILELGDYVPGIQSCFMLTSYGPEVHCEPAGFGEWAWMLPSFGLIKGLGSSLIPTPTVI